MKSAEHWFEISKETPASAMPLPLDNLAALEKLAEETFLKFIRDIQADALRSAATDITQKYQDREGLGQEIVKATAREIVYLIQTKIEGVTQK